MMYIEKENGLSAASPRPQSTAHPLIRFFARFISFIFHPLFIPVYITAFLLYIHEYSFIEIDKPNRIKVLTSVFINTAFFPALSIFLLRKLKFIDSIFLRTQKERIIPYVVTMFFYFWAWYVFKNLLQGSSPFMWFMLGIFLASIAALLANIYCKISMHAIAMGNVFTFFMLLIFSGNILLGYAAIAICITGLVLTCRLLVSDHYPFEVYIGFLLGIISQMIAVWFV